MGSLEPLKAIFKKKEAKGFSQSKDENSDRARKQESGDDSSEGSSGKSLRLLSLGVSYSGGDGKRRNDKEGPWRHLNLFAALSLG